ncbi:MAG TPA: hypothetical protein VG323_07450 [Thermoanaerobaculia bacterium]|nr:hypothetical protein [Thermoanaerobaculia bacterium]
MSQVRKHRDDENAIELEGQEAEEVEAAIAEADAANPEDWVEFGEFMRRLRNGE